MLSATQDTARRFESSIDHVPSSQLVLEYLVHELKSAYHCMSDLSLTRWQASHLLDIAVDVAESMLGVLVASGFLKRNAYGSYTQDYRH